MFAKANLLLGTNAAMPFSHTYDYFDLYFDGTGATMPPYHWPYMIFGGSSFQAKVGRFTGSTVTGVGFQPDCILIFGNGYTDNDNQPTYFHFGVATGTAAAEQWSTYTFRNYLATPIGRRYWRDGKVLQNAALQSFDSDGFTIDTATSNTYIYVAIKDPLGTFKAGYGQQPTTNTTQSVTGLGFNPGALLMGSAGLAANNTESNDFGAFFGFAADPDGVVIQQAGGMHSAIADTSNPYAHLYDDRVLEIKQRAGGSYSSKGTAIVAFVTDGFDLTWSNADGAQRRYGWLAFETLEPYGGLETTLFLNAWFGTPGATLPYSGVPLNGDLYYAWGAQVGEGTSQAISAGVHSSGAGSLNTTYRNNEGVRSGIIPNGSFANQRWFIPAGGIDPFPPWRLGFTDLQIRAV